MAGSLRPPACLGCTPHLCPCELALVTSDESFYCAYPSHLVRGPRSPCGQALIEIAASEKRVTSRMGEAVQPENQLHSIVKLRDVVMTSVSKRHFLIILDDYLKGKFKVSKSDVQQFTKART